MILRCLHLSSCLAFNDVGCKVIKFELILGEDTRAELLSFLTQLGPSDGKRAFEICSSSLSAVRFLLCWTHDVPLLSSLQHALFVFSGSSTFACARHFLLCCLAFGWVFILFLRVLLFSWMDDVALEKRRDFSGNQKSVMCDLV